VIRGYVDQDVTNGIGVGCGPVVAIAVRTAAEDIALESELQSLLRSVCGQVAFDDRSSRSVVGAWQTEENGPGTHTPGYRETAAAFA
jgi:hypothetical protein